MFKRKTLVLALAGLIAAPAFADMDNAAILREMRRLAERVEQLEASWPSPSSPSTASAPGLPW